MSEHTQVTKIQQSLLEHFNHHLEVNPFAKTLGISLKELRIGYIHAIIPFREDLCNVYGDLHGGSLFAIADTVAGMTAASHGYFVTTAEANVSYVRAAKQTTYINCKATTLKTGKTITNLSIDITDETEVLLCTFRFTMFNLRKIELVE